MDEVTFKQASVGKLRCCVRLELWQSCPRLLPVPLLCLCHDGPGGMLNQQERIGLIEHQLMRPPDLPAHLPA